MQIFESAQPILYHASFHRIRKFWPLTHFGTYKAALSRIIDVLDDTVDDATGVPDTPVLLYPVRLEFDNPLRTRDTYNERPYIVEEVSAYVSKKFRRDLTPDLQTQLQRLQMSKTTPHSIKKLTQVLHELGYDVISYTNRVEDPGHKSFMNLTSDQVHMWAPPIKISAHKLFELKKHKLGTWRSPQLEQMNAHSFVTAFDTSQGTPYNDRVVKVNHNTLGI
jgi:hypothetical protein